MSEDTRSEFDKAVEAVNNSKHLHLDISRDALLKLYGLYKQATIGCILPTRPGGIFNLEAKAKWDAWDAVRTMSKNKAKEEYVRVVSGLKESTLLKAA